MTKKSLEDYSCDILQLTVDISLLPPYHPAVETLSGQLSNRLSAWQALLDIVIRVAENEGTPWLESELGLVTIPMEPKKTSGYHQVGDYYYEILNDDQSITVGNLVVERKTCADFYGTLMSRDSRLRFMNEISRYEKDPRFNQMVIIVECNKEDFLTYIPGVYVCTFGQIPPMLNNNLTRFFKRYYKMDMFGFSSFTKPYTIECVGPEHKAIIQAIEPAQATLHIDGVLRETLSIKYKHNKPTLYLHRGASIESRRATVAKLVAMGIYVEWAGSREEAQKTFLQLVRQSCIKNYKNILNIEV
jgi:hypothetical protein